MIRRTVAVLVVGCVFAASAGAAAACDTDASRSMQSETYSVPTQDKDPIGLYWPGFGDTYTN